MDGEPLVITDLVNSQLVFAIPVVEQHIKKYPERFDLTMAGDLVMYKEYAEEGKLYEHVAAFAENYLECNDRKEFKQRFFKDIFFSRVSNKKSKIKNAFNMLFPMFAEVVADIKKEDYTQFAISCQRLEASVMIDIVLRRLMDIGVCALSLHDSIIVSSKEDMLTAEGLITEAMNDMHGVKVSFKRETALGELTITGRNKDAIKSSYPVFDPAKWEHRRLKNIADKEKKEAHKNSISLPQNCNIIRFDGGIIYPKSCKVRFKGNNKIYRCSRKKIMALLNIDKNGK